MIYNTLEVFSYTIITHPSFLNSSTVTKAIKKLLFNYQKGYKWNKRVLTVSLKQAYAVLSKDINEPQDKKQAINSIYISNA